MHRVVSDSVVFVRALLNPSGMWGRLVFLHWPRYELVVSTQIVEEVLDVIQRPQVANRARGDWRANVQRLRAILDRADHVAVTRIPAVSRDPKDDVILATAFSARAEYLVTEDDDLLVLGTHSDAQIVTATAFLDFLDRAAE